VKFYCGSRLDICLRAALNCAYNSFNSLLKVPSLSTLIGLVLRHLMTSTSIFTLVPLSKLLGEPSEVNVGILIEGIG